MRVRYVLQAALVVLLAVVGMCFLVDGASAQTQTSDLTATIASDNPLKPRLRLENSSERACQIATTAQGTVAITKVTQDGKLLQPVAADGAFSEDVGYLLKSQLKTLAPGDSVEIPLQVFSLKSGTVLRATMWSSDAGTFTLQYAIAPKKSLTMELSYSLPIMPGKGAPACGMVFASTIDNSSGPTTPEKAFVAGGVLALVLALAGLVIRLLRARRHRAAGPTAVAAILVGLGILGLFALPAPRASADIVVPSDLQADFDSCMAIFNANRDITGPALDVINNPANHVEIVYTSGGSDMTGIRNGSGGINITIYWNPDDRHPYAGTGGSSDMCTPLYHEMFHALDMSNGTFSRNDCAGSGIETKEVMATRAQNVLRARLGMPERSHYGERALPSGDCSAPPSSAHCTGPHCGDTNGDPHLRTFDGLRYDFQAAGEFILARNKSGSYEIQARQEPWETSRIVSLNTAVALKIGSDRLEIRAGKALELLVNGKRKPLADTTLPGSGKLALESGVVVITWPDTSKAFVRSVGAYGLAISVQPSEALSGDLEGLLGDANGNSNNDLRTRGSIKSIKPTHDELYPVFADSWRITDKTSLFTYTSGKNTASYTDKDFPDEHPDPKSLPGYAAAEAFCRSMGVTDPAILANCALDMAITGRPEFARAASHSQTFAAGADFGGTTWQLTLKNPGDSASVTFDAKAGEKVFVEVPASSLPSQCGGLRLFNPEGHEFMSGCIINGRGEIDGTVLPTAGTYTIKLASNGTGTATVRLLRITDTERPITPDGPRVTARIDKPGVVARYTFSGKAGQRMYVEATASTLDSQCGLLRMFKPNGNEIISGCIINGIGDIDTISLPEDGLYTIAVDPRDTVTGTAQLRLIAATAETKPIAMDGPTLTVNLAKPGSIAQFTFQGVSGQRIFVDVPSSELPSQCGILELRAPGGGTTGSGCIINHRGDLADDGVVLPTTGTYTLVLDPNDAATGKTTIRLRSR